MSGRMGQRQQAPQVASAGAARMWNSMRQLRSFTTADLEATAEVGRSHATKYVRLLLEADYLVKVQEKAEGVPMGHAVYRLKRNTGPVPPRACADGVYDANLVDPYRMGRTKRLCRHAHAMHKALREIVDAFPADGGAKGYGDNLRAKAEAAKGLLQRIDRDSP